MLTDYILRPSNIRYNILEHFPALSSGKKTGVFLSGGMESTLIGRIALELYGRDRVMFFYSDDIFCLNDKETGRYIHTNVNNGARALGVELTYVEFDYDFHLTDRKASFKKTINSLKTKYDIEFVFWGFTKLFFDVEVFKDITDITADKVKEICYNDPVKFKSVIEEFHVATDQYTNLIVDIDIPHIVYEILNEDMAGEHFVKSPFNVLNKAEVVDLYRQCGWLDLVFKTGSCLLENITEKGEHCGTCFNCQQRYDAFDMLNILDRTPYTHDMIKERRQRIKHAIGT
jgi:7-cyano-7-deazaguanine synthase in queuosine biosynthesis